MPGILEKIIKEAGYKICKTCDMTGKITTFCGHDVEEVCPKCKGEGIVKK